MYTLFHILFISCCIVTLFHITIHTYNKYRYNKNSNIYGYFKTFSVHTKIKYEKRVRGMYIIHVIFVTGVE